jgi:hypothetical protein
MEILACLPNELRCRILQFLPGSPKFNDRQLQQAYKMLYKSQDGQTSKQVTYDMLH